MKESPDNITMRRVITRTVFICLVQVNTYRVSSRHHGWRVNAIRGFLSLFNFTDPTSFGNGQIGTRREAHALMADDDLFNGWKAIATYLKISEKNAPPLGTFRQSSGPTPSRTSERASVCDQVFIGRMASGITKACRPRESNRLIGIGRSGRIAWTNDFPSP